ncbi:E3 ubiquitin-protein ligase RNF34 [Tetranychus urticae]|uniref:RING-type domain-containing protein n=1 Tax=Tetranychus urticae TaxID=32264 RepID=T1KBK2_TETUR|nr:E3 ubiquitin-protein ligase RNF34 [Tetranychus urticae]
MNASTFFNRSTGPQASTNSRPSNPRVNPGTGINANSPTSPTVGSSSSTTANGFNFHFEFPSINFANITDTLTSARFSPPNLSTLIPKQRSSTTTTRNETPSPSTSTGSNPSSGSRLIMVCENCGTKFHFLKRKKTCSDCSMDYCVNCFPKDGNHDFFASLRRARCRRCRIFNMQPLERTALLELRIKDLKWYMDKKRIPHRFCKEKSELVDLILRNGDHGRRHYSPSNSYPTSPLNNLNTSSNTSSNHSTNRIPRQDEESWVFVETEDPINRPSNINRPPRDNSSEANNINTNTNTSTTTDTPLILTSNTDSTADSNSSSNSSTTDATTSGSTHRNEETVSKENINYDSNSSSSLNTDFKPFNIADLTSEEQIRDLSIRQIKLLLTRNFVDFKGCCEKEELLEKAIRLWRDVNKARERGSQDLDDDNACKICMEKLIDCVLLECGHVVTCIDCGKRMNECPICRQYVVRAVRIFKS